MNADGQITARLVFQIITGEPARERDLSGAEMQAQETTAATGVVFLMAECAAFDAEGKTRREAVTESHQAPIFLKGGSVSGVRRQIECRREAPR